MPYEVPFRLTGHVNPRGALPAICVPTFSNKIDNYQYVQVIGIDHKIMSMDIFDPNPWESSGGAPVEEMCVDASGWAVYWISLDATVRGTVVGHHAIIRRGLLRLRAQIASVLSPFERLDFAQLSEDAAWYGEEAEACEKTLSNGNDDSDRALEWLRDAVLIGRVRLNWKLSPIIMAYLLPYVAG